MTTHENEACIECGKERFPHSLFCRECFEKTCPRCRGEKSVHAQTCATCEKNWTHDEVWLGTENITINKTMEIVAQTLKLAKLKQEYIDVLLRHEREYAKVFTSKTFDPVENYEVLEFLGDGVANSCLTFYLHRRFPLTDCKFGVKLLDLLKRNYVSKRSFSSIAYNLGFWPYIRASADEKNDIGPSLLEDVLEAFIGATVKILDHEYTVGVGYGIVYKLLEAIFDDIPISLEYTDLYDPRSRLKEIFDAGRGKFGILKYVDLNTSSTVYRIVDGVRRYMGKGENFPTQAERQQAAAKQALALFPEQDAERKRAHDQLIVNCAEIVLKRK